MWCIYWRPGTGDDDMLEAWHSDMGHTVGTEAMWFRSPAERDRQMPGTDGGKG